MKLYREAPMRRIPFCPTPTATCAATTRSDRPHGLGDRLLAALCPERRDELLAIDELIYHAKRLAAHVSEPEAGGDRLAARADGGAGGRDGRPLRPLRAPGRFAARLRAHVLRTDGKRLVRLLYRFAQRGGKVEDALFDFANLLSGYFFLLALALNHADGVSERPSRAGTIRRQVKTAAYEENAKELSRSFAFFHGFDWLKVRKALVRAHRFLKGRHALAPMPAVCRRRSTRRRRAVPARAASARSRCWSCRRRERPSQSA